MSGDSGPVVVFAEILGGKSVSATTFEALNCARHLSTITGSGVCVLLLGHELNDPVHEIERFGCDICMIDDRILKLYHPEYYLAAFLHAYEHLRPSAVVMGHSLQAIDLAPRIAYALDAGLVTDCVGIASDQDACVFYKPVFSSHVMAAYEPNGSPYIITIRPKSFGPALPETTKQIAITNLAPPLEQLSCKLTITARVVREDQGIKIEDAGIIVAGGRGIGTVQGFQELETLAHVLGAAVGASRPPVDLGLISANAQVGQTGAIVAPDVYFAVGISGSIQHLAGMSQSKVVVAINKDAEASIFKVADYGVVGNYEEVVPALTASFKASLKPVPEAGRPA